jgi:hypothetical protein
MSMRRALVGSLVVLASVLTGCGGGDDSSGGGGDSGSLRGQTVTVWNNEFQPDRM